MQALDRAFVAGDTSDHDVAEFGGRLHSHNHEVAVENASANHGFAADAQHKQFAVAGELGRNGHEFFDI